MTEPSTETDVGFRAKEIAAVRLSDVLDDARQLREECGLTGDCRHNLLDSEFKSEQATADFVKSLRPV